MDSHQLETLRRSRRHPRRAQFDYLHLKTLIDGLQEVLERVGRPGGDVLDVFCGTRPYEDLMPPGSRVVGLDVTDEFGVADVVSQEFLPFDDDSFDLAISTEAFHYVPDPEHGARELARVLRPGGTAVLTLPCLYHYDRAILEHRFTGPELEHLFRDWDGVQVIENGGRAVGWAYLGGTLARALQRRLLDRGAPGFLVDRVFALVYLANNALGAALERWEQSYDWGRKAMPAGIMLVARAPGPSDG